MPTARPVPPPATAPPDAPPDAPRLSRLERMQALWTAATTPEEIVAIFRTHSPGYPDAFGFEWEALAMVLRVADDTLVAAILAHRHAVRALALNPHCPDAYRAQALDRLLTEFRTGRLREEAQEAARTLEAAAAAGLFTPESRVAGRPAVARLTATFAFSDAPKGRTRKWRAARILVAMPGATPELLRQVVDGMGAGGSGADVLGRVAAHPNATSDLLHYLLDVRWSATLWSGMLQIPAVRRDPALRARLFAKTVSAYQENLVAIGAELPADELRPYFVDLAAHQPTIAARLLVELTDAQRSVLRRADVLPLLRRGDAAARTVAMVTLHRLQYGRREPRGPRGAVVVR